MSVLRTHSPSLSVETDVPCPFQIRDKTPPKDVLNPDRGILSLGAGDFAILGEPSHGTVEGGCNGNLRAIVRTSGVRAHSARAWVGVNAIHAAAPALARLAEYRPRDVSVDGLVYREGLNAVRITGGIAGNVIPDSCEIEVNYRFAPSRSGEEAER